MFATSAEPPYETNGSGRPVVSRDPCRDGEVHECVEAELQRESAREQEREVILRARSRAHPAPREQGEQDEQDRRAEEAGLFGQDREDEVRGAPPGTGDWLQSGADAAPIQPPEPIAISDWSSCQPAPSWLAAEQNLQERGDVHLIRMVNSANATNATRSDRHGEMAQAPPAGDAAAETGQSEQPRTAQVRLEQDQPDSAPTIASGTAVPRQNRVPPAGLPPGEEHHRRESREVGGLDREEPDRQPAHRALRDRARPRRRARAASPRRP